MLPASLLTLAFWYMCTSICINFLCIYSLKQLITLAAFKSIIGQSRCPLGPKSFLRAFCPLKSLLRVSEHPLPLAARAPSFVDACYACFFSDVYTWIMPVFYLDITKQHENNLSAKKSNILFGIPQYIK